MRRTLGYHLVKSGYGLWLPGDERGHWSSDWDEQIGYTQHHQLNEGDPVRLRMAEELLTHSPVRFTPQFIAVIADTLGDMVARSDGGLTVSAATIEPTHAHWLLPYTGRDIDNTAKWIADQTTKAVHCRTNHTGPLWCRGKWCVFIYDAIQWNATADYIERHNLRVDRPAQSYPWITPVRF